MKVCPEATKTARVDQSQKMDLKVRTRLAASERAQLMKVEATHSKVTALMMKRHLIRTKSKKMMSNTMLVSETYQVHLKCSRSLYLLSTMNVKSMKALKDKMTIYSVKSC